MILTTAESIAGYKVVKTLGIVRGNTVRACHMFKDIRAFFKNMVGGEIAEYTKLLAETREQSLDRMAAEAQALGANAIISVRLQTSMIMGGTAELLAYGTAVIVEPI
jgi:uncharacterized protein YbjQ (UPF0145 family)